MNLHIFVTFICTHIYLPEKGPETHRCPVHLADIRSILIIV